MFANIVKLFFGSIFCGFGILLLFFLGGQVREDAKTLSGLEPLKEAGLAHVALGERVLVEGTISGENGVMVEGLVLGYRERYHGASDSRSSYWEREVAYNQPVLLDVGETGRVVLDFEDPYPSGEYSTIRGRDGTGVQWIGYERGSRLCVVGRIVEKRPVPTIRVDRLHGAYSRQQWLMRLESEGRYSAIFGMVALMLGIGLLAMAVFRRAGSMAVSGPDEGAPRG